MRSSVGVLTYSMCASLCLQGSLIVKSICVICGGEPQTLLLALLVGANPWPTSIGCFRSVVFLVKRFYSKPVSCGLSVYFSVEAASGLLYVDFHLFLGKWEVHWPPGGVYLLTVANLCSAASGFKQDVYRLICGCFITVLSQVLLDYYIESFRHQIKQRCVFFICVEWLTEGEESLKIPYAGKSWLWHIGLKTPHPQHSTMH